VAKEYEILSIGNAIVDILSHVGEDFISAHALQKGTMRLVDENQSKAMLAMLDGTMQAPGGSAANTAACIASLGASSAYIGKVAEDDLGLAFREGMGQAGVDFSGGELHEGVSTANCLAVVTPDGERTMSTFLGACRELSATDISEELVAASKILFLEGYLLDSPKSAAALQKAAADARANGTLVALTLSDANCVRRNSLAFRSLIRDGRGGHVDVLIANEKEIAALLEVLDIEADDTERAISICRDHFDFTTVVTLGPEGAVSISGKTVTTVPAIPVDRIVDLVGAGDSFAAGYLVGHARDLAAEECLKLGAACASEIITTDGARPLRPLSDIEAVADILNRITPAAA
jgi:sugar/nucleoside kinase (ribokinase family)